MNLKEAIYDCLSANIPQLQKDRKDNFIRWKAWSDNQDKRIIVFGASILCEFCIRQLEKLGIQVDLICDNNQSRFGEFETDSGRIIKIVSVEDAMSNKAEKLCFVATEGRHFSDIYVQLEQYQNIELVMKWRLDFYLETVDIMCFHQEPFLNKVTLLLDLFEDDLSLKILWGHFSMVFDFENIPEELSSLSLADLCDFPQYFLEGGRYLEKQGIMVDCGAFVGDTLKDLVDTIGFIDFERYDCFELFPDNFLKLQKEIKTMPQMIQKKIQTYNVGVGNCNNRVNVMYSSANADNVTISCNGEISVKIIRLDDFYQNERVTFLKMDIEGSEQSALRGAKQMISRSHPMCAICVYHTFASFWEIPQMLKEYVPDYKLILRHHTTNWADTVCYAKTGSW